MAEQDTSRLGDALGVNRGLDTKTVPTILGGLGRRQDLSSRAQYAREKLPELTGRQMEEEFAARVGKSRAEQTGLRGEAEAAKEMAGTKRGLYERADTEQKEYQKFEAPKYTTEEYVGDAAKRLLMGLLMGGVGKVSSINQLRAIKTMQEAEDANQMDRYEQAVRDWEQNEKARLDYNKRLKERIENALKLSETDYAAAMAEARLAAAQAKEGTIAADLNQMKLTEAIKKLEATDKLEGETQSKIRQLAITAESKRALGPDRRLKPGERWNAEKGVIEAIEGSDLFKKQKATFTEDYKAANSTIDQTEEGLRKLESIIDPKRADAFGYNFGGYAEYAGQFLPGGASDMRKDIESFKSVMKNTGLSLIRMGGSIGQITEREWPIIEKLIASIDPVISEEKARETFEEIKARFQRLIERTRDGYETEYGDSQFYKPLKAAGVGSDSGSDLDTLRQQANDAIRNGADANAVRQRFRDMTGKEL